MLLLHRLFIDVEYIILASWVIIFMDNPFLSHLDFTLPKMYVLTVHVFMLYFWLVSRYGFLQILVVLKDCHLVLLLLNQTSICADYGAYLMRYALINHFFNIIISLIYQQTIIFSWVKVLADQIRYVICFFRIWPGNQDTSWRLLLVLNRNKISMLVSKRLVLSLEFCCFAIYDLSKVLSTVFRELHDSPVSLWRPSNWVGWVWVVQDCYTH